MHEPETKRTSLAKFFRQTETQKNSEDVMTDRLDRITGGIGVGILLVVFLTVGAWGQQGFTYSEESSAVILS